MFGPEDDAGCKSCSFWADNFDPNVVHPNARDVTFVAVLRAPSAKVWVRRHDEYDDLPLERTLASWGLGGRLDDDE
jgi:hypothetical protein